VQSYREAGKGRSDEEEEEEFHESNPAAAKVTQKWSAEVTTAVQYFLLS